MVKVLSDRGIVLFARTKRGRIELEEVGGRERSWEGGEKERM